MTRNDYLKILKGKGENHPSWKGGFPKCIDCGKILKSRYAKRCLNCYKIWQLIPKNNPNYNGKPSKKYYCQDCKQEISYVTVRDGLGRCLSCSRKGDKNYKWIKNRNLLKYSDDFTDTLKESIRKRDNYECQNCGIIEEEHLIVFGKELSIHHIDYDKNNCNKENLISLCISCHMRSNYNRPHWQELYMNKIILAKKVN